MIKTGEKVGHFLIQAEIGRGGMGTIYYALDTMLNREVALKAIHPQLADNQQLMDRFKIEAMTQARMNHPNIVTIFSFNKIDDQYFIAMEYVEGKSLKELLQAKRMLAIGEAVSLVIQVAEGLAYAHSHNVIHRDIKPANILLGKDNHVKISDFGIAKVFGAEGLTKTGMMMGTPWYTPPEQIMGKNIDFRADLYSLGVTFYELLTSRVPFDSETNSEFQIQKAHLETPPPRPSTYNPQISARLENIILRALQKKVEKRYQSAGEMIAELKKVQEKLGKTGVPEIGEAEHTLILDAPPVKRRHSFLSPLNAAVFLLLLVAGGVFWMIVSGKGTFREPAGVATPTTIVQERPGQAKEQQPGTADAPAAAAEQPSGETMAGGQNADAGGAPVEGTASGQVPMQAAEPAADAGTGKDAAEKIPERDEGKDAVTPAVQPVPLGSLEAELIRLRGLLAQRKMTEADQLADALEQASNESRIFPFLGNVKFFQNKFAAAERLWLKGLQADFLISLDLIHVHADAGDSCRGQLKFNRKNVMFSSNDRGDHSFALQVGNIQSIRIGEDRRIIILAAINGQELNESFELNKSLRTPLKERFLVDFLNRHVL
jgi:serine/threonine-protein kinase